MILAQIPCRILLFLIKVASSVCAVYLTLVGMPAQQRLAESNVLIVGLGGEGVPIVLQGC
jgi:molybdopterin/thiamine biosynthesis adenylyltransferase